MTKGPLASRAVGWPMPDEVGVQAHPVARASDHAIAGFGRLCLKAFLIAQFFSLTRLFFVRHLGGVAEIATSQAGMLSVALLLPAVVAYGLQAGSLSGTLVAKARLWLVAVACFASVLFLRGWLREGFALVPVVHDLAPYVVILAGVILGSIPRVWRDIDRLVLFLFLAALVVNALGMSEMTMLSEADSEDRIARSVLAYRTQSALAFWPLLFLTARLRGAVTAFLIFVGVYFVLGQQISFQKRAPTARIVLFLLVFLVILPRLLSRASAAFASNERRVRRLFLGAGALATALALSAAPWVFQGQLSGLAGRMSGEAYGGGVAGMLIWENERLFEARMFLRTLEPQDVVFGRAFGGYFVPDTPGWGVWMNDVNEIASRHLHVGLLLPFFKGGLLFAFTYYAGVALTLVRGRRSLSEPVAAAAFFVVLLHFVFLFQESWFHMSTALDLTMVSLCMGHLLSRDRDRVVRDKGRIFPGGLTPGGAFA